jgi:hypothetical protein
MVVVLGVVVELPMAADMHPVVVLGVVELVDMLPVVAGMQPVVVDENERLVVVLDTAQHLLEVRRRTNLHNNAPLVALQPVLVLD